MVAPTTMATIESATAGALTRTSSPAAFQATDGPQEYGRQKDPNEDPEEYEREAQDAGVDAVDQRHGDRKRRDRNSCQHRAQWKHHVLIV